MATTLQFGLRQAAPLPDFCERGQPNDIRLSVTSNGSEVIPDSGTISIFDPYGQVVVDAQPLTIPGSGAARYTWTPDASTPLGEGWRIEWSGTFASGPGDESDNVTLTFQRSAMVVRHRLVCPVSTQFLWGEAPALNPSSASAITALSTEEQEAMISIAFVRVQQRLLAMGKRPWLVVDSSALGEVITYTALQMIFGSLSHRTETYAAATESYRTQAEAAWLRLRLTYDESDDGIVDEGKVAAMPSTIWFGRGR